MRKIGVDHNMWPGSDLLTMKAGGGENRRIKGTRRSSVWERQKVDFALLVLHRQAWATWCWELTTLWVARLNNGVELKVTDPKE